MEWNVATSTVSHSCHRVASQNYPFIVVILESLRDNIHCNTQGNKKALEGTWLFFYEPKLR